MKIKIYVVTLMLVILAVTTVNAELPYESDQEHSFVLTGGKQWYSKSFFVQYGQQRYISTTSTATPFTLQYSYQNTLSLGLSYHHFRSGSTYANTGRPDTESSLGGVIHGGTAYDYNKSILTKFYNISTQFNISSLLKTKSPISVSMFAVYQFDKTNENLIFGVHLYKEFQVNKKSSIQPTLSIGYRDASYFTNARKGSLKGSAVYTYSINDKIAFLLIPKANYFLNNFDYAIEIGMTYGVGK